MFIFTFEILIFRLFLWLTNFVILCNNESDVGINIHVLQDGDDSSEEAVADAVSRHVKAPPPSIPTNIFSPTEQKTMDFPDVATPSSSAIQQPTDDKAESPSTARPQRPKVCDRFFN